MKQIILIFSLLVPSLFAFEDLTLENFESKTVGKKVILDFYTVG